MDTSRSVKPSPSRSQAASDSKAAGSSPFVRAPLACALRSCRAPGHEAAPAAVDDADAGVVAVAPVRQVVQDEVTGAVAVEVVGHLAALAEGDRPLRGALGREAAGLGARGGLVPAAAAREDQGAADGGGQQPYAGSPQATHP
ncbi:hypothetical protein RB200_08785 [Streptomyces sp. PmtG]